LNRGGLLVSFAPANLLATAPISQGGPGASEGALIPSLVAFEIAKGPVVLGAVAWRLVNF
jgi:hypothetical protein